MVRERHRVMFVCTGNTCRSPMAGPAGPASGIGAAGRAGRLSIMKRTLAAAVKAAR
jgi:Low molecular weight phosphotyrosine protein phosphatase